MLAAKRKKTLAVRTFVERLNSNQYKSFYIPLSTVNIIDFYRQLSRTLGGEARYRKSDLFLSIQNTIRDYVENTKRIPVITIDEAQLMRLEVFAQMHTLGQFEMDSKALMPLILCGQNSLIDKLMYHTSRPIASRVVGRSHFEGLKLKEMRGYIGHHLEVAGIREQLFSEEAILAIHEGSGGLLRRANTLARGALIAATREKCRVVSAEHVRVASTEVI